MPASSAAGATPSPRDCCKDIITSRPYLQDEGGEAVRSLLRGQPSHSVGRISVSSWTSTGRATTKGKPCALSVGLADIVAATSILPAGGLQTFKRRPHPVFTDGDDGAWEEGGSLQCFKYVIASMYGGMIEASDEIRAKIQLPSSATSGLITIVDLALS